MIMLVRGQYNACMYVGVLFSKLRIKNQLENIGFFMNV